MGDRLGISNVIEIDLDEDMRGIDYNDQANASQLEDSLEMLPIQEQLDLVINETNEMSSITKSDEQTRFKQERDATPV